MRCDIYSPREMNTTHAIAAEPAAPVVSGRFRRGGVRDEYLDIYVSWVSGEGQWISCALVCPSQHKWVYIEQIEPPAASEPRPAAASAWAQELRKVPHTVFAKSEPELLALVRDAVAQMVASADGGAALAPLLRVRNLDGFPQEVDLPAERVRVRPGLAREFARKCGAARLNRPHALLWALELAVSDESLRHAVVVEEITRLELLLGTKNAQSMRAWLRRRASIRARGVRRTMRREQQVLVAEPA